MHTSNLLQCFVHQSVAVVLVPNMSNCKTLPRLADNRVWLYRFKNTGGNVFGQTTTVTVRILCQDAPTRLVLSFFSAVHELLQLLP